MDTVVRVSLLLTSKCSNSVHKLSTKKNITIKLVLTALENINSFMSSFNTKL
jgi:hypothetical protein